ncbi:helix-turn-helix domain-containing protein [Tahibacter amnicola]|uniref:Helix-turn-helix transcriptional regulator n=1 Tax=Tahibacter amnicola TaxID=2976241 RepID=A0ABY6BC46_9GAMM|nr:helix-turn-helix transcriptional regulator [Tahibacter amnicola]UXI65890.1 helix-turn-helix transcriptional regulator [Tahibacter amnicola]
MSGSRLLIQSLRGLLRERGITYRELAARLGVSEPTVKRDFSRGISLSAVSIRSAPCWRFPCRIW